MCGGGGASDSPLAQQSALQEQARQANIQEGMRQIQNMFGGGAQGTGQLAAGTKYTPGMTLYDKNGQPITLQEAGAYRASHAPVQTASTPYQPDGTINAPGLGGSSIAPVSAYGYFAPDAPDPNSPAQQVIQANQDSATMQSQLDALIASGVYTGKQDIKGYDDSFYDKAYQAQLDYALPQVDQQFQKAQRDLTFALARQGLNASSQGNQLMSDLESQRQLAIQGEQDKARGVRNDQVNAVESERDNLTKLLQSTGDVASTMNAAAARKSVLDAAPAIQEVGPLFQNATGTLADMIVNPALRAAGNTAVSKGYGSSTKGSGKVVT